MVQTIGICKELDTDEGHQVILLGHLPMEISFFDGLFFEIS